MNSEKLQTALAIVGILVFNLLLTSPSLVRQHIENDEVIYKTLISKTNFMLEGYTLRDSSIFTQLPDIYDTPIFFHPPLFLLLGKAVSLILGEDGPVIISVVSSLSTAFLIFLLGRLLYDYRIGLVAMTLWTTNPLQLFVAQRIWLDSLMVFFVCLAVYLSLVGTGKRSGFFLLAGLVLFLGVMTKYPAMLAIVPVFFVILLGEFGHIKKRVNRLVIFFLPLLLLVPWFYYFHLHAGDVLLTSKPTLEMLRQFPCTAFSVNRPGYFLVVQTILTYPIYLFALFAINKRTLKSSLILIAWAVAYFVFMTFYGFLGGGFTLRYILPAYPALSILAGKFIVDRLSNNYIMVLTGCFMVVGLVTIVVNNGNIGAVDIANLLEGCASGCTCISR